MMPIEGISEMGNLEKEESYNFEMKAYALLIYFKSLVTLKSWLKDRWVDDTFLSPNIVGE